MNLPSDLPAFDPWSRAGTRRRTTERAIRLAVWIALAAASMAAFWLTEGPVALLAWGFALFTLGGGTDAVYRLRKGTRRLRDIQTVRSGGTPTKAEAAALEEASAHAERVAQAGTIAMIGITVATVLVLGLRSSEVFGGDARYWTLSLVAGIAVGIVVRTAAAKLSRKSAASGLAS